MGLTKRMDSAAGWIGAGNELMNSRRRRWAQCLGAFACGMATMTLMPLLAPAREQIDVPLAALAGVIVASLMVGVGLQLHLSWLTQRFDRDRLRWMMLVLLGWATAAIGWADWPRQFLLAQLIVGVIAGATLATFALPGLPALYGAGTAAVAGPALCRALTGTQLGVEGSWPLVCGFAGVTVLVLAALSHTLARLPYFEDESAAKGNSAADGCGEEMSVAATA